MAKDIRNRTGAPAPNANQGGGGQNYSDLLRRAQLAKAAQQQRVRDRAAAQGVGVRTDWRGNVYPDAPLQPPDQLPPMPKFETPKQQPTSGYYQPQQPQQPTVKFVAYGRGIAGNPYAPGGIDPDKWTIEYVVKHGLPDRPEQWPIALREKYPDSFANVVTTMRWKADFRRLMGFNVGRSPFWNSFKFNVATTALGGTINPNAHPGTYGAPAGYSFLSTLVRPVNFYGDNNP